MFSPGGFDATVEKWSTLGVYARVKLLEHLPKKFMCIAYDRRETGQSGGRVERISWQDFVAQGKGLLEHLQIERAHLIGGCMGCSVAIAFAVAHPQSVMSMILWWPVGGAKYRIKGQQRFAEHLAFVQQQGLQAVVDLVAKDGKAFGADPRGGPWASVIRARPRLRRRLREAGRREVQARRRRHGARAPRPRHRARAPSPRTCCASTFRRSSCPATTSPTRLPRRATSKSACRAPSTGTSPSPSRPKPTRPRASCNSSKLPPPMIIDIHGHYTTEPQALQAFRDKQLAGIADPARKPASTDLGISDEALVKSVEPQLKFQKDRGSDLTVFSPRASGMAHHVGTEEVGQQWARVSNDLIHRICTLLPDNFAPVGQLPQFPGAPIERSIPELERLVKELGFVGVNLNPDPSGGYWKSPPLTDRYWYPIYEKLVELEVPAMIHVTSSCNPGGAPHRRPLPQRRHHGVHAAPAGRPLQGLSRRSSS